jgi:hypothetical protein
MCYVVDTSLIKMKHFKGNIIMNNTTTRTDLINLYQSLDLKKPRITKGLNWQGFEVVKIEKLNNDYQIHLQNGDYQEVKSWETIKRFNELTIKRDLIVLQNDNFSFEISDKIKQSYLAVYNELSSFYYDSLKAS